MEFNRKLGFDECACSHKILSIPASMIFFYDELVKQAGDFRRGKTYLPHWTKF